MRRSRHARCVRECPTSIDNLFYPVTMGNDLLQLKFKPLAQDTGRFLMNTLVGVGGLFDPATQAGLPKHEEDWTDVRYWGVKPGPYFMIPITGPFGCAGWDFEGRRRLHESARLLHSDYKLHPLQHHRSEPGDVRYRCFHRTSSWTKPMTRTRS